MNQNILKKISIINSSKEHNVELAIIDDFTKESNNTIKIGDLLKKESSDLENNLSSYFKAKAELESQKTKLTSDLSSIQNRIDDINVGYNVTSKIYADIVKKASDIGINYPKNIDVAQKTINDLVSYTKSINTKNVKL
jgi:hypothetical protein